MTVCLQPAPTTAYVWMELIRTSVFAILILSWTEPGVYEHLGRKIKVSQHVYVANYMSPIVVHIIS